MKINQSDQKPVLQAPKWLRTCFSIMEKISPFLSSRIATRLFFTPIKFKTPDNELAIYNAAKKSIFNFKKYNIQMYEWGSSKNAVLLVHGWSSRGTQIAHLAKPLIENGYKVYSFDAPAHGKSNGKKTNIIEISELILKLEKKYVTINALIGHSIGGTACIYALSQGSEIKKCVTISSPASSIDILASYCKQINVGFKVQKLMKNYIEKKLFKIKFDDLNALSLTQQIVSEGLVIHCNNDVDTSVNNAHSIHKNWKKSKLVLTNKLGHRKILRNKTVSKTIVEFLNS